VTALIVGAGRPQVRGAHDEGIRFVGHRAVRKLGGREVNRDRIRKPAFGSTQSALNEQTILMVGLAAFICGAQSVVLTPMTFEYFSGMGESPVSRVSERVIFKS